MRPAAPRFSRQLPVAPLAIGVVGCLLGPFVAIAAGVSRPLDLIVAAGMVIVGLMVATTRPAYFPVLMFAYVAFNRLLRRVLDYSVLEFSTLPPTSLVAPALGILVGLAVLTNMRSLPKGLRRGASLYLGALAYGAVIGVTAGPAMAYEVIQWVSPFGFGLFVAWLRPSRREFERWVFALALIAGVGMAYGWFQWLTLPPWDEFWMRECGMGTIGRPFPKLCRFFGPFAAHGSAAGFSMVAVTLLVVTPTSMAPALRYPLIGFLAVSLLMTGVRSDWIAAVVAILVFAGMASGRGSRSQLIPLLLLGGVLTLAFKGLPNAEFVGQRLGSLGNVASDRSFQSRLSLVGWTLNESLGSPQGKGLGTTGLGASRLADSRQSAFDNGYLHSLYALGLPGCLLLIASARLMLKPLVGRRRLAKQTDPMLWAISIAVLTAFAIRMLANNVLRTEDANLFWMFVLAAHTWRPSNDSGVPSFRRGPPTPRGVPLPP